MAMYSGEYHGAGLMKIKKPCTPACTNRTENSPSAENALCRVVYYWWYRHCWWSFFGKLNMEAGRSEITNNDRTFSLWWLFGPDKRYFHRQRNVGFHCIVVRAPYAFDKIGCLIIFYTVDMLNYNLFPLMVYMRHFKAHFEFNRDAIHDKKMVISVLCGLPSHSHSPIVSFYALGSEKNSFTIGGAQSFNGLYKVTTGFRCNSSG